MIEEPVDIPSVRETPRTMPYVAPSAVTPSPTTDPSVATPPTPIMVAPPVSQATGEFPDVPAEYWAYPFITNLSQRGIISGFEDGTFRPEQPVTRAEYAALLERVLPPEQAQQSIAFTDIPSNYWAAPAIDEAVKTGFLKGYPEGNFAPDQPISKVQVLASLVNGVRLPESANASQTAQTFQDSNQIPQWAIPAVGTATESNIVVNYPDRAMLNPNQPITRAEIAALVYQALVASDQVEPIQSEYIVRP
ncbi:MAG: S-layer homology domain-containing protein [Cyanobacteria bacterium RU_5_0]|nr:S-layer homology domain-containing protein [Cyanobacteria bacterium RU_5_0]